MNERLAIFALAVLALLSLWLAPWAALNREIGAYSTVLLLPNRVIDFTGRTEALSVPGQGAVLVILVVALLAIAGASALRGRTRYVVWALAGLTLLTTSVVSLVNLEGAVAAGRKAEVIRTVERAVENPRDSTDVASLEALLDDPEASLGALLEGARSSGVRIRRLPYEAAGMGLAAFVTLMAGALSLLFSLRGSPRWSRAIDRLLATVAVPATSISLALLAAAVVILALQPTPIGRGVEMSGGLTFLTGRLDTLWYAYQTLFADSLGTLAGFMEALKFSTPLILTGLAVAFGFQAGLFNIGAPGQMVLGALFAMFVGVYLPGPRLIVLPLAVLASALGGGLWGALPGWLKARFGANEVINTILLNYIAASLLLFVLSSNQIFAAGAVRIILTVAAFTVLAVILSAIPPVRRGLGRAPRLAVTVGTVLLLGAVVVAGLPRAGDAPINLNLPFKAPGSEPKSYPLSEAARLSQVPALVGIDIEENPGVNIVALDYALPLALLGALLAFWLLPKLNARFRGFGVRLALSMGIGGLVYGLAAGLGARDVPTAIPPTSLNTSFLVALGAAVFMYYLLWRTKWGYELRAVGVAPKAAEYGGASIARNVVLAMAISGAFAGLASSHYVLGGALEDYSLRQSLPTSDGFDGIAVALLGGNTPVGVVLSAFLFGVLKNGGSVLNITFSDLTRDVVNMILALVVLFIAARGFLPDRLTDPLRRANVYDDLDPERTRPLDPPGEPVRSEETQRNRGAVDKEGTR